MICPKCKSNVCRRKFCGDCGNQLLEFCPDGCGKWESISRPVCETAFALAEATRSRYLQESKLYNLVYIFSGMILGLVISILLAVYIGAAHFTEESAEKYYILIGLSAIFIVFSSEYLLKYRKRVREQKFLQKFPGEAEIIRLAERGDKNDMPKMRK